MKLPLQICVEWMGGTLLVPEAGGLSAATASPEQEQEQEPGLLAGASSDTMLLQQPALLVIAGYSIDSRTVQRDELFFAVSGERFDGHAFVADAMERGAAAAVVAQDHVALLSDEARRAVLVVVDDPLLALQRLAAAMRRHWGGTLIGVTGSAGKTTTKEMVAEVLGAKYKVLRSAGNLNNHFGLPLQLLRLEQDHQYAVIEMGMSAAGEIALLARLAAPDWAVVCNVGMAHAQNFADGIEGIALAKRELVDALQPETGVAFLNGDDTRVAHFAASFAGRSVLVGRGPEAEVRAAAVHELGASGLDMEVEAVHAGLPQKTQLRLQFLGGHNVGNALLALAVGLEAGVPLADGAAALARMAPGEKRGETVWFAGARIINDSYNSNPAALHAMIAALMQVPAERHIVVAGEMLELGPDTGALHAACGAAAAEAGAAWVIGVQGAALALAEAAALRGTPALFLQNADEAGAWMRRELRPGDAVLLKGSRGVRLERALLLLQAERREG
ncbi:UDP-N-acetylmuramoyl-tripeptide--D-alanyl-D-alanine ligase [Acidipila sp. EB88]|uniref:UDP-N-acetylmuramoyl-tripeptide--D-alanyl-D- alanine ligase n=1 Tax=Acidipila sp. EB88 TaxID=2305226 RepID=UPI000F5E8DD7|nr:UDP-N-acetylmuramoyl-tripeptide--D-alanyl-D-alanine ligase [Acidipila sp. EB88]RRA48871.1 UDP-N-acetylmuramoyl-tripeptide--D-alanyl-D-alanine ligase [Acidipila sp. EB88]